jgi:hypothetical protein
MTIGPAVVTAARPHAVPSKAMIGTKRISKTHLLKMDALAART